MTGKSRLFSLGVILTVVSMAVGGIALALLYNSAFDQQRARLIDSVKSQRSLIETVARYDQKAASQLLDENPEYDAFEATLGKLREAHTSYQGLGETGEFTLARVKYDSIVFLLSHRHHDFNSPHPVSVQSREAEPMRRALGGQSGTIVGLDYRGAVVLAAYEPVLDLGLGIVAKIDLSEIREPFIKTGLMAGGVTLVIILMGAMLVFQIGNPLVRDLIGKEALLLEITSTIPGCIYQIVRHNDGSISLPYMSAAINSIAGIRASILTEDVTRIFNFIHPDDHLAFRQSIKQSAESMMPWYHDFRVITTDGRTIWLNGSSNPISIPDSSILWNGVLTDITGRKQAEKQLKEANNIINKSSSVAFTWRNEEGWPVEFVTNNVRDLLGYSSEQFVTGEVLFVNCIHPDDLERVTREVSMFSKDEDCNEFVHEPYRIVTKDDTVKIIKDWTYIVRDAQGNITHFKGIVEDITELKLAERANIRLLRAIEQADETIVITDAEGIIEYANPAFEKTTGYAIQEVLGQKPSVLKSGQHNEAFYVKMWETLSSGNQWCGEIVNRKKDGTLFTENAVISPVFDAQLKIVNYVAAKNDITETKRLQALESRAARLETAGIIAGQVAHDFNNLLAPLMMYPEFIREELPANHPSLSHLDQIQLATQRLVDINQDLLTMGRRGHYNLEALNLNSIVQQVLSEIRHIADKITYVIVLSDELMDIHGGSSQLHRMISNLLANAQDAMHGSGQIIIKTENYYVDNVSADYGFVPIGTYAKLTITDAGCGIPVDEIDRIFDAFFTNKTADKRRGSGLGLSVVESVIKDHDGFIDVSTEVNKGTSFYVYIPISGTSRNHDITKETYGGDESILVIDDDVVQCEVSI